MCETIAVMVLEPDDAFRSALCASLGQTKGITVTVASAHTIDAPAMVMAGSPDVLMYGFDADPIRDLGILARIFTASARAKVVIISGPGQDAFALEALRLGALSHLERADVAAEDIVAAIRAVARGEAAITPRVAGQVLDEVLQRQHLAVSNRRRSAEDTNR